MSSQLAQCRGNTRVIIMTDSRNGFCKMHACMLPMRTIQAGIAAIYMQPSGRQLNNKTLAGLY